MNYFWIVRSGIIILIFLQFEKSHAQVKQKIAALNRIEINSADTLYRFYAIKPSVKLKLKKNAEYTSYNDKSILVTQGGISGRILNGDYWVYFPNKQLKENGKFKNGIKTGEWKIWYSSGKLAEVAEWKAGYKISENIFDSVGNIVKSGKYKGNRFSGFKIEKSASSKYDTLYYNKGILLRPKENTPK
jgi:hypothetical protein